MAPDVNWGAVDTIAKGELQDVNEETMEEVVDILRKIDENDFRDNVEKLMLLLQSAKKVVDVS